MTLPIRDEVRRRFGPMVELRRDLHRHPELGFREHRTSAQVLELLRPGGMEVRSGIAETGLAAVVRGRPSSGRAILFRADMNGLPLQEENEVDYASQDPGAMHACGHDGHTAILLETALLSEARSARLPVDVTFAFQPAEEGPGGALPMIEQGVLENPRVEAAFGLHLWNVQPIGKVAVTSGPCMAAADEFELMVTGKGGHGAYPHATVDAVVVASHIVTALQTLVSRNTNPFETAVVSVGTFHAGSNFNIIAERAHLRGTLRTFVPQAREMLVQRLEEVVTSTARAFGARCEFVFKDRYPVTVNDPEMADFVAEVAGEVVGRENVLREERSMGGEDMSFFFQRVPGCFFFLGSKNSSKGLEGQHHSPRFDFDEDAMPIGAEIFLRIQERYAERFPQPPQKVAT